MIGIVGCTSDNRSLSFSLCTKMVNGACAHTAPFVHTIYGFDPVTPPGITTQQYIINCANSIIAHESAAMVMAAPTSTSQIQTILKSAGIIVNTTMQPGIS